MWQKAQASLRFTESCLSYSIDLPSSSICWTWLSGGAASRSSVPASIRSISASTCAISASASGVSVVLASCAPSALAHSVTMIMTAPVIKAFIQRDLVIGYPVSLREAERLLRLGTRLSSGSELCPLKVDEAVGLGAAGRHITRGGV